MILGLTGSVGGGKSTVARMLQELGGAVVIDADAITRQLQAPGGEAFAEIVRAFGPEIVASDGTIDRARLGSLVFSDGEKLKVLNSIVHPKVRAEELRLLGENRDRPLVVLMVPLLFENKMQGLAGKTLVVTLDEATRRKRLRERDGLSDEKIARRLAAQMPDAEKAKMADYVVDNSGTLNDTREQVLKVVQELKR
jgi:dephospho-CoA kinase